MLGVRCYGCAGAFAVDGIVAQPTKDRVIADTAFDRVVICAAINRIVASATKDLVVAVAAEDAVSACATVNRISASARIDSVIPIFAIDDVRARTSLDRVIARAAIDDVIAVIRNDRIVSCTCIDRVVARARRRRGGVRIVDQVRRARTGDVCITIGRAHDDAESGVGGDVEIVSARLERPARYEIDRSVGCEVVGAVHRGGVHDDQKSVVVILERTRADDLGCRERGRATRDRVIGIQRRSVQINEITSRHRTSTLFTAIESDCGHFLENRYG